MRVAVSISVGAVTIIAVTIVAVAVGAITSVAITTAVTGVWVVIGVVAIRRAGVPGGRRAGTSEAGLGRLGAVRKKETGLKRLVAVCCPKKANRGGVPRYT